MTGDYTNPALARLLHPFRCYSGRRALGLAVKKKAMGRRHDGVRLIEKGNCQR